MWHDERAAIKDRLVTLFTNRFRVTLWESITLVFARVPSHILPPWTGSESPQIEANSLKPNSGTASSLSCNQATQIRDFLAHR